MSKRAGSLLIDEERDNQRRRKLDVLSTLPTELLLSLFQALPGFASVCAFARVNQWLYAVWKRHAESIGDGMFLRLGERFS